MSTLGDFIRARRKILGLTQTALATRIGVDDTYVSAVETGKRTPDGQQFLEMMSVALELTDDLRRSLAAAARKSQRIFRLPVEISTQKHEVLQALALDTDLSDDDMAVFAAMHTALARGRLVGRSENSTSSLGGPM